MFQTEKRPQWYVTFIVECDRCWKQYPMIKKNIWKYEYCCKCSHELRRKPENEKARYHKRHLHHMHWTHFYKKWTSMIWRCNYPTVHWYKNYWGRWIKCEWEKFEDFYKDMYESYLEHYNIHWEDTTLDRIDVNGNYSKENCRWKTMLEQQSTKRTNHSVIYKWIEYPCLKALCRMVWQDYPIVFMRIKKYWWDAEKALDTK